MRAVRLAEMTKDSSYYLGWEVNAFSHNHHVILSENFLLFFVLLCGCMVLQHVVEKEYKIAFLPGALATMLVSIVVGGIIRISIPHDASFSPLVIGFSSDVLYFGLLPPIIFDSAYHLRRRLFFGNLGAVFSLACAGTIVITILTALGINVIQVYGPQFGFDVHFTFMERIAFACALSATDPVSTLAVFSNLKVDPTLFYAMLGESVLNDAVAITAFRVSSRLIGATSLTYLDGVACAVNFIILAIGSSIIGYGTGVLVALGLKYAHFGKDKVVPMGVVVCTMYIPFFLAEILQLSGVVAIFFAGIAARRYVHKNLTLEVRKIAAFIFRLMAHCAETTCFVLLGLSVFLVDFPLAQLPFMLLVLVVCLLARPLAVYPLLSMLNLYRHKQAHRHAIASSVATRGSAPALQNTGLVPTKRSAGYGSVPTKEENLESGTKANKTGGAGGAEDNIIDEFAGDASEIHASHARSHAHKASPHVHFAPLPSSTVANPLSGLYHSLSSDSSLTGYEAAADLKSIKLPLAKPISLANMHVIAFAGMRGAVSFSLAYIFPDSHGNRDLVLCTAIVIVLFTSFFNGMLTEPLIRWLNITTNVDMGDYLKKHAPADDSFEFERQVLYPLILKPRAAPYHKRKMSQKETSFSPMCGPCMAEEDVPVDSDPVEKHTVALVGARSMENARPLVLPQASGSPRTPALTPFSLHKAGISLHSFFHDRGFYHMRAGRQNGRAMSDTMSSGGGSLASTEDHSHHHRTHSPEHFPEALHLNSAYSGYNYPNAHGPGHAHHYTHPPLYRRGATEEQKNHFFSFSPVNLPRLPNPFAPTPLLLSKPKSRVTLKSAALPRVSEEAAGQLPMSVMDELKQVIAARRTAQTDSASPAPLSGVTGPSHSVFNHLSTPNTYYTPLLRALSPAEPEPPSTQEGTPHSPGSSAPVTPDSASAGSVNRLPQRMALTWRTVKQAQFTSPVTAMSLRGTSAGMLGDTASTAPDHAPRSDTANIVTLEEVESGLTVSGGSSPHTGGSEETECAFKSVG